MNQKKKPTMCTKTFPTRGGSPLGADGPLCTWPDCDYCVPRREVAREAFQTAWRAGEPAERLDEICEAHQCLRCPVGDSPYCLDHGAFVDDDAAEYADQRTEIAERLLVWAAADQRARDAKWELDRAEADMDQALSGFSADELQQLDESGIVQIRKQLYRVEIGPNAGVSLRACIPLKVGG